MQDDISFRKKSFGELADDYQKYRKPYNKKLYDFIFSLLNGKGQKIKILDIGCGTGKSTEPLLINCPDQLKNRIEVTGCDHDQKMLEQAIQSAKEKALNIKYVDGSAEMLPFDGDSFDCVIAGTAFHWFATRDAFAEIKRVIKENGFFLVFWADPVNFEKDGKIVGAEIYKKYKKDSIIKPWRDLEKTKALFEESGFRDFKSEKFSEMQEFTLEELVGRHKTTSKYATLSLDDKKTYISEFENAYKELFKDKDVVASERELTACYAFK